MSFRVVFTLVDAYNRTTRREYGNNRALLADALTDVTTMTGAIEGVSGCSVQKVEITNVVTIAAPSPDTGANLDAGATLHVKLDNGKFAGMKIPAFDPSLVNTDGTVKIGDALVTAFTGLFATGQHWTISEGNTVAVLKSGELDR